MKKGLLPLEKRIIKREKVALTVLKNGEIGIVTTVKMGHGKGRGQGWSFGKRLLDMGLTPGTKVMVVKTAPFHGPVEILVRGSRLALGRGMAERVFVERAT